MKLTNMQDVFDFCAENGVSLTDAIDSSIAIKIAKNLGAELDLPPAADQVRKSDYKGNALVEIIPGVGRPFSFGQSKAKMLIKNYEKIKVLAKELWPEDFKS